MSISFGGLGLMSLRNPFAVLVGMVLSKTDLRFTFCLVVFCIVVLVLAYLTNPSENSFRTYLTEQSFRHHLSRLDDNTDDDRTAQDKLGLHCSSRRGTLATFDNSSPFHFANRASISLRTPKHVFHTFGIFTIAAMVPLAKSARADVHDELMISDSWYVGAFGRWWRGGILEAWYQDVIARSKDEESWSSGILSMKSLDMLNECNRLPFSTNNLPPHLLTRGFPPKLRNRERPSQRLTILPPRSSTPPPLPKSASLPLHTARLPSISVDRLAVHSAQSLLQSQSQSCLIADQVCLGSPVPSRSPSMLFDQSPPIAEVLRQISHSKAVVLDLRSQLTDCQTSAAQSHTALQGEVDFLRERKRHEDATKLELKSRTKTLDDSRRSAESTKREAEKKLKAAQNARDGATQRIEHLDQEIARLQQRLTGDEVLAQQSRDASFEVEQGISEALEQKKQEIKVAEDIVTALNQRAKELEEKFAEEREKLRLLKERADAQRHDRSLQAVNQHGSQDNWPASVPLDVSYDSVNGSSVASVPASESGERRLSLTGFDPVILGRRSSASRDPQLLSRSANRGGISNLNNGTSAQAFSSNGGNATHAALRPNGYSIFDQSVVSVAQQRPSQKRHSTSISPFGDSGLSLRGSGGGTSPTQSLISSVLTTSVDNTNGNSSRSFQSDNDVYLEREWRGGNVASPYSHHIRSNERDQPSGPTPITSSPISLHGPSANDMEHDPFEIRFLSPSAREREHQSRLSPMDIQRASWLNRAKLDPHPSQYSTPVPEEAEPVLLVTAEKIGTRRWFSTTSKEKPKKGLNPDAKVFSFARKTPPSALALPALNYGSSTNNDNATTTAPAFDALNPNGLGSKVIPPHASADSSLLRAFAPSPAEREALQRALGGSTNASFERLPSLSDVGSIPPSPAHVHMLPAVSYSAREVGKVLPSWLQSLPRFRKPNFSPWDDEEDTNGGDGMMPRKI